MRTPLLLLLAVTAAGVGCNEIAPLPALPDVGNAFVPRPDGGARIDARVRVDSAVNCAVEELCDGRDNDCDGRTDEGFGSIGETCSVGQGACRREGMRVCDVDGTTASCTATKGDAVSEICLDRLDNDCDGFIDEAADADGDGVAGCIRCANPGEICEGQSDCDDNDVSIQPGAFETCDGRDNDCDGTIDEGYDEDGDGFPTCGLPCRDAEGELTLCHADCRPNNAEINPASVEICNGLDDNCNEEVDEYFSTGGLTPRYGNDANCGACGASCLERDATHNTVPRCVSVRVGAGNFQCNPACLPGFVDVDDDAENGCECEILPPVLCDDGAPNDGRCSEACDGLDNDCDGIVDEQEGLVTQGCWPLDNGPGRGVGACFDGQIGCDQAQLQQHICLNVGTPSVEICNIIDDDCDGRIDEGDPGGGLGCDTGLDAPCSGGTTICRFGRVECVSPVDGCPE